MAKRLSKLREEKGWSQYELATRLGIQRPRYNAWEQGKAQPRAEMLNKIAELFDVSTDYLLGHDEARKNISVNLTDAPDWATTKDIRDFKKMLEEDEPVMFDGVPIDGDAKRRVMDVLTGLFWEAKEMNKKTYGKRKTKKESANNEDNE